MSEEARVLTRRYCVLWVYALFDYESLLPGTGVAGSVSGGVARALVQNSASKLSSMGLAMK